MKYLLITLLTLTVGQSLSAQRGGRGDRSERLEAHKVAFITEKLELTPEEAQQFWPVYNEFQKKERAMKEKYENRIIPEEVTDAEAEQRIAAYFAHHVEMMQLEEAYIKKLDGIISPRKQMRLLQVEKKYRGTIMKKLRKRLGNEKSKERKEKRLRN